MAQKKYREYISTGNRKMSYPTWSIPAIATCPGCTGLCSSHCYARKAEIAYKDVLPCRIQNLRATQDPEFVDNMIIQISRSKRIHRLGMFRIHESGDFYKQEYLDKWFAICRMFPDIRFLAFSKSFHLDYYNKPENLNIVWSIWADTDMAKVPAGPRTYAGDCVPAGTDTIECMGHCDSCGVCWKLKPHQSVHFEIH